MIDQSNEIFRILDLSCLVWKFKCYTIRDAKHNQMVAIDFETWVEALVFLEENAKVI